MKPLTKPENLMSVLLILGTVLPWLSFGGESVAGYQLAGRSTMVRSDQVFYLVYAIPLLAVLVILGTMKGWNTRLLRLFAGVLPLGLFLYMFLEGGRSELFKVLGVGGYVTILAAIGMLLSLRTTAAAGGAAAG